jgi:hypothetical protein
LRAPRANDDGERVTVAPGPRLALLTMDRGSLGLDALHLPASAVSGARLLRQTGSQGLMLTLAVGGRRAQVRQ